MNLQRLIGKYHDMSGHKLPDDLIVTVMVDMCTKDLREYLEMKGELKVEEARDEIMSYIERKRTTIDNQVKATDVDNCASEENQYHKESWEAGREAWPTNAYEEINYMANTGGWKR